MTIQFDNDPVQRPKRKSRARTSPPRKRRTAEKIKSGKRPMPERVKTNTPKEWLNHSGKVSPIILAGGLGNLQPKAKIKGRIRTFALQAFVDGDSYGEIARKIAKVYGVETSRLTVRNYISRNMEAVKAVAEASIGVALNQGLANKATRIKALIAHYDHLCEMIEQHRVKVKQRKSAKPHDKRRVLWETPPPLSQLLAERRKTVESIRAEVEPFKVNIHEGSIRHIHEQASQEAVRELRDEADQLDPEVRELLGEAIARHESRGSEEIRGELESRGISLEPEDRPPSDRQDAVGTVPLPEADPPSEGTPETGGEGEGDRSLADDNG